MAASSDKLRATVDDLGVEAHLVKEAVILSQGSRSSDKFMHGIRVLMTKNYIDNLRRRCARACARKPSRDTGRPSRISGIATTRRPEGSKSILNADRSSRNYSSGTRV